MKNGDVLNLYQTIQELVQDRNLKFNIQVGYTLLKNKAILENEAKIIYEARCQILEEYGQLEGNVYKIPSEKIDEANLKIQELMEIENEIGEKLKIISFDQIEENLRLDQIEGLMPILNEPLTTSPPILNLIKE